MKLRSGGMAPLLAAEAAASLANGLGEVVGQLASLIWSIKGLDLLSLLLGLLLSVGDVHQVAVSQVPHRVASSADLLVHLITTPDAGVIQGVEVATVGPGEVRSMKRKLSLYLLVKLVGHGTANPAEESSGGQGGLLAKAHGCSCGGHRPSSLVEVNQAIKA